MRVKERTAEVWEGAVCGPRLCPLDVKVVVRTGLSTGTADSRRRWSASPMTGSELRYDDPGSTPAPVTALTPANGSPCLFAGVSHLPSRSNSFRLGIVTK